MRIYAGNDSSLVLYMTTTGPSFLFTGDMEAAAERRFLQQYGGAEFGSIHFEGGASWQSNLKYRTFHIRFATGIDNFFSRKE